jgi:hypothetical protein
MKQILKNLLTKAANGEKKSKTEYVAAVLIGLALFSTIATIVPLLLVYGISLLGFPVAISFKSWCGSLLIMIYFIAIRRTGENNNQTDSNQTK